MCAFLCAGLSGHLVCVPTSQLHWLRDQLTSSVGLASISVCASLCAGLLGHLVCVPTSQLHWLRDQLTLSVGSAY